MLTALIFGAASNLDTLLLALAWGLRGTRLSPAQGAVITLVTTAVTWLALTLGRAASSLFPPDAVQPLGALVLVAMGLWVLLDWLRRPGRREAEPPRPSSALSCVPLAAAPAVNNGGIGAAAGVAGLSPLWAALVNLAVTFLCLWLGERLGRRARGSWLEGFALPASGLLLVVLGGLELFL